MYKTFKITCFFLFLSLFFACRNNKEEMKLWKSGAIEEFNVTPINGGAIIDYTIPDDPDILYIMAKYERNGEEFTEKSSVYDNFLKIEGFDQKESVKVELYKVNRKGQQSQAKEFEFTPLKSLIKIAQESLSLEPTFGGVVATWENPENTELGAKLVYVNEDEEIETNDVFFSTSKNEQHVFRGFDPAETTFGLSFEDKWGNISDTTWLTATPLFETQIKKPYSDYRANIPYDNATNLNTTTYTFDHIWDEIVNTSHNGWLTTAGSSGLSITIDIGEIVKLSRIVIHGYHVNAPYGQVNITAWEAWGTDNIDFNRINDKPYWLDEYSVRIGAIHEVDNTTILPEHTFKDDWQYLGNHEIIRYDLMDPPDNQGITNISENGSEYMMPLDAEPVRYVRIFVREIVGISPPPSNNYFSMGEITFYGDNTVSGN